MKKFLIIFAIYAVLGSLLSGCGQSDIDVESDKNITNQLNSGTYSTEDGGARAADDSIMIRTNEGCLMTVAMPIIDPGFMSLYLGLQTDSSYARYERWLGERCRRTVQDEAMYWSYPEIRDDPDGFQLAVNQRLIKAMVPQVTLTLPENKE